MRHEFDADLFRQSFALCVVKHDLPFQFAEYDGVEDMFAYLNPDVKLFLRQTIKNDVLKLYTREKEKLIELCNLSRVELHSLLIVGPY